MTPCDIKTALIKSNNQFAMDMVALMERKAAKDAAYDKKMQHWLKNGGTVILRDDLCLPFKNSSVVAHCREKLPFDNMWIAIDTAWLHAKIAARGGVK